MVDWTEVARYGLGFDAASGVLFVALGVVVLFVRPRRRIPTLFGIFAVGFGVGYIFQNLAQEPMNLIHPYWTALSFLGSLVSGVAATLLALRFPGGAPKPRPRGLVLPAGAALFFAIAVVVGLWRIPGFLQPDDLAPWMQRLFTVGSMVQVAGLAFTSMVWSARLPDIAAVLRPDRVRQVLVASLALFLYGALQTGMIIAAGPGLLAAGLPLSTVIPMMVAAMPAMLLWIALLVRATAVTRPPISRWTRNAALIVAAGLPVGTIFSAATDPSQASNLGLLGLTRTAGFIVLSYMILRHQLLGVDVAFKFTVKQSTVAAVFVAVFFAVSELSAAYLTDQTGSTLLGVGATAVLVFAIHPLQRMGDRVADAAMPGVKPLEQRTDAERSRMYEEMAREAWADGSLSKAESRVLDVARQRLGLTLEQAHAIETKARA